MPSSEMLRRVALVRTDISAERNGSIMRVRIGKQGTMLAVTSNRHSLKMEALRSSETSVLTITTWGQMPEDGIVHRHCCENLKSYIALTGWFE
jgi:hypothetical protein